MSSGPLCAIRLLHPRIHGRKGTAFNAYNDRGENAPVVIMCTYALQLAGLNTYCKFICLELAFSVTAGQQAYYRARR